MVERGALQRKKEKKGIEGPEAKMSRLSTGNRCIFLTISFSFPASAGEDALRERPGTDYYERNCDPGKSVKMNIFCCGKRQVSFQISTPVRTTLAAQA